MATQYEVIENNITGQRITFLQTAASTNGELLEMEAYYSEGSPAPPSHLHPNQDEYFTVLSGTMQLRMRDVVRTLHAGDAIHIPPNTPHSFWNNTALPAVVNWKTVPALTTEHLIATNFALANAGKTDHRGMPHKEQLALMAVEYSHCIRMV